MALAEGGRGWDCRLGEGCEDGIEAGLEEAARDFRRSGRGEVGCGVGCWHFGDGLDGHGLGEER